MKTLTFALGFLLLPVVVVAQSRYVRVLLPIHVGTSALPGANGSQWVTELTAYNANDTAAGIATTFGACGIGNCSPRVWPPHSVATPDGGNHRGMFLYIDAADDRLVKFNLRAQDISRQALTWGTELPVVRKSDYSGQRIDLLNIPLDRRFRQTTRIYDYETASPRVLVRVFPMDTGRANVLLGERIVQLGPSADTTAFETVTFPSFAQLGDIGSDFPAAAAEERVRLEITPIVPGTLIWAFTSVTHNDTQHVTLVTPQ